MADSVSDNASTSWANQRQFPTLENCRETDQQIQKNFIEIIKRLINDEIRTERSINSR